MKLIAAIVLACAATLTAAEIGKPAPKLAPLIPGAKIPNMSGKVVLVDFWASWCGPCKASFPAFNRLHEKYAAKGLVIVAVGVDEDPAKHAAFAGKMGAKFSVVHDSTQKAAAAYGPPTMPTSYLIDRKGVIRHINGGFKGAKSEAAYASQIEALLK